MLVVGRAVEFELSYSHLEVQLSVLAKVLDVSIPSDELDLVLVGFTQGKTKRKQLK